MEGGAPFTLIVNGVNFISSSTVLFGGTAVQTTYVSSQELKAVITTADLAPAGGVSVSVKTPSQSADSNSLIFALTAPPNPVMQSLNPTTIQDGAGAFTLKVLGIGFIPASYIEWNATQLPTTYVSASELDAQIPATDVVSVGSATVSVKDAIDGYYLPNSLTFMIGYTVTEIDRPANDLVWDPSDNLIYLSLRADSTEGSQIATLDPATDKVTSLVSTLADSDRLAISDDSSYLYAGIDYLNEVVRYALPSGVSDETINLPPTTVGSAYALDMAVAPGLPHTFAVTIGAQGIMPVADGGIVIYDDASARPGAAPAYWNGKAYFFDSIQWGSDTSHLYAADSEDTSNSFYILNVDATGITSATIYPGVFYTFGTTIHYDAGTGYLYSNDGLIIDPTIPDYAGQFNCDGYLMVPDSTTGRAYFLGQTQDQLVHGGYTVWSCDMTTHNLISSVVIPNVQDFPRHFIRFGTNGLAFQTDPGQIFLIQGDFVAP